MGTNRDERIKRLNKRVEEGIIPDKMWFEDDDPERLDPVPCSYSKCRHCSGALLHVRSKRNEKWHFCPRCDLPAKG